MTNDNVKKYKIIVRNKTSQMTRVAREDELIPCYVMNPKLGLYMLVLAIAVFIMELGIVLSQNSTPESFLPAILLSCIGICFGSAMWSQRSKKSGKVIEENLFFIKQYFSPLEIGKFSESKIFKHSLELLNPKSFERTWKVSSVSSESN